MLTAADCKKRRKRDQRDGGEVLKQQHGEAEPAVPRREFAVFLHDLQRERRRRQRQRRAGKKRRLPGKPEGHAEARKNERRDRDLRPADAEDRAAHRDEPFRAKLKTNDEQQQHDAELGDMQDFLCIVRGERAAQSERPDQDAGDEIAEHRGDPEPARQRPRYRERRQQKHDFLKRHVAPSFTNFR